MPSKRTLQRRPAGQADGSGELQRDGCNRRAFPVAVVELGENPVSIMRISVFLSVIVAILTLSGCGSNSLPVSQKEIDKAKSNYDTAVKSGVNGDLYPGQFNRLFPGAANGISYNLVGAGPRSGWSKAPLHGRYILQMIVPI